MADIATWAKSWKTTAGSIFTAFFGFVSFKPEYFPPWMVDVSVYLFALGFLGTGLVSKDYNISGGTSGKEPTTPIAGSPYYTNAPRQTDPK